MTASRWDGSAQQSLTIFKRWDGSAMVDLTIGNRWDGSAWINVLPVGGGGGGGGGGGIVVSLDTTSAYGKDTGAGSARPARVFTNYVTVTPSGGTAPYTYSWKYFSDDEAIKCESPTGASTRWYATLYPESSVSGMWKCTVTDSAANSTDVYVDISIVYTAF